MLLSSDSKTVPMKKNGWDNIGWSGDKCPTAIFLKENMCVGGYEFIIGGSDRMESEPMEC